MSDILVLNEGGKKKMKKKSFLKRRFTSGISDLGYNFPSGMKTIMKRDVAPLLKPVMKKSWAKYKSTKSGSTIRPFIPQVRSTSLPASFHLGFGSDDNVGLNRMTDGWIAPIDFMKIVGVGGGIAFAKLLPKQDFIPTMFKTGLGKNGLQLGTGVALYAIFGKILKQEKLGEGMFTGAVATVVLDLIDTYAFGGKFGLGSGLAYYIPEKVEKTGLSEYLPQGNIIESNSSDDDGDGY